jgi:hypothetical protein
MKRRKLLSTGIEVEWQPVPTYALLKTFRRLSIPKPTMMVDTSVGEQEIPIGEDTPEWEEYTRKMLEAREEQNDLEMGAVLDYGIVRWRNRPNTALHRGLAFLGMGYQWCDDAPRGWSIPEPLANLGVESSGSNRLDYILLMLLADPDDFMTMLSTLQGTVQDLTPEEVESAEASFPDGVEGDATPVGAGDRSTRTDDVLRTGGGEELGDESEGMVQ